MRIGFFRVRPVVFSTDAPFVSIAGTIEVIETLELEDERRSLLYRANAERLLNRSLG